jgi:hypothetical protein
MISRRADFAETLGPRPDGVSIQNGAAASGKARCGGEVSLFSSEEMGHGAPGEPVGTL